MNTEKLTRILTGAAVALLCGIGAAGCLLTGFTLNVESSALLWLSCTAAAFLWAALAELKWGGAIGVCLLAVWAGFLWLGEEAGAQILQLLYRISYGYDQAYGWGVLKFVDTPWNAGFVDIPLQIIGCLVAASVSTTVCRGIRTWPGVTMSMLPLVACLVVTDTVPEERYLFLLLTGLCLLILSSSVRRMDTQQAGRLVRLLAIPVAAALVLLFHAIPHDSYVNQSEEIRDQILNWAEELPEKVEDAAREAAASAAGSDDETVNLKTLGRRSTLAYPVMEVTSDRGGILYLRERDYDSYNGTGWVSNPNRSENLSCAGDAAGSVTVTTRRAWDIRFLPYYPQSTLTGGSLSNAGKAKTYTIPRWVLPENWRSLVRERAQGIWESEAAFTAALNAANYLDSARFLLLPTETLHRAEQLLPDILEGAETATDKADAIAAYVRGSAEYDRDMERMPADEPDFALWFLENSDKGYCVHFATAAVVLLRAADVPARYVTGYLVNCPPGETVTVTADTAHAWAEYYEPQLACWIPLEATPGEGLPTATAPAVTTQTTEPSDVPTQQTAPQPTAPEQSQPVQNGPAPAKPTAPSVRKSIPLGWLWLMLPLGAVVLQRPLRIQLRRQRYHGKPNTRALGYWQEILLLSRLLRQPAPGELERLAQKAKFSQHTLTAEELAQMNAYIDRSITALKERPWYQRLLYRLVYAAW